MIRCLAVALLLSGCAGHVPYAKIGAGYKFHEAEMKWLKGGVIADSSPISARGEIGLECEAWSYGVSHHSQWFSGYPFNANGEYYKTELFVDYKITF